MAYIGNSFENQATSAVVDYFNGDSVTTTFTLSRSPLSAFQVHVVVNNVPQNPGTAYSIVNNQIIFTEAPSAGTSNIYVRYNGGAAQTVAIGQGTVYPESLAYANAPSWDTNGNFFVGGTLIFNKTEQVKTGNYTLTLNDRGYVVAMNNSSPATVTIPVDSNVNFPVGTILSIARVGTGSVTLASEAGVSLSKTGTFGTNEEIYLRKRAANTWIVVDAPTNPSATGGTLSVAAGYKINTFSSSGSSGSLTVG